MMTHSGSNPAPRCASPVQALDGVSLHVRTGSVALLVAFLLFQRQFVQSFMRAGLR